MYPINLSVAVSTVSLPSCLLSLKNRRLCVCVCAQNTLESLAKGQASRDLNPFKMNIYDFDKDGSAWSTDNRIMMEYFVFL